MPIKSLQRQTRANFPNLGDIRKGAPQEVVQGKNGEYTRVGRDLDYFRFAPASAYPELAAIFEEAHGKEPTKIPVALPFTHAIDALDAWMIEFNSSGIVRRCDGERMVLDAEIEDYTY